MACIVLHMTRRFAALAIFLLSLTTEAAGAGGVTYLSGPMPRFGIDTPAPISGYTPAPVPKQGLTAPRAAAPKPGEPEFSGSLRTDTPQVRTGHGYTPGSNFSEDLQRRNRAGAGLAPSLIMTVPVEN